MDFPSWQIDSLFPSGRGKTRVARQGPRDGDYCSVIQTLNRDLAVAEVPVIGYAESKNRKLQDNAVADRGKLMMVESPFSNKLPQLR